MHICGFLFPQNRHFIHIMEKRMDIGDRLRKVRKQQKLTAKQLSEKSGVPVKTIYRIETGEVKDPRLSSLEPLIKTLNCSADELLFDADQFTNLERLRQAFARATQLHELNLETLIEVVNKFTLACSFEEQISQQVQEGNYIYTKPEEEREKA